MYFAKSKWPQGRQNRKASREFAHYSFDAIASPLRNAQVIASRSAITRMLRVCAVWGRHCALFDALAFRRTWRDAALKNENPLLAFAPGCFPNILLPCSLQTLSSTTGYRKISAARILDIFCAYGERQMRQKMNQAARIIHFRQKISFLSEIYAFFCNLTCKFPQ